jgi:ubiquinone/menaquinone biosynthesis C-methylase UbiE
LYVSTFNRVTDIYDTTRALPDAVMVSALDAMKRALSDCTTIIDVGAGTGRFAEPLQRMGFHVVVVDISWAMLAKTSEKGVERLVLADAHNLPIRDKAFDAAVVVHVLHLVKDWLTVTREVGRVCRKKTISLIGRTEGPSVRSKYLRLRSHFGYALNRFEGGEEGFRRIVQPVEVIKVKEYVSKVSADDDISYLEERGSSVTWGLDEDVHRKIIAELRVLYGGRILRKKRLVELAIWHPDQWR